MADKKNIYETVSAVMTEIGAIGKNSRNEQQKFMFRGIDAVMNALAPALQRHKLFIVPEVLEHTREERTKRSVDYNGVEKVTTLIYSICKIKYRFIAEDGSFIESVVIGEGMDSGDKATNKAMSIAFKYACFQVFCIPTEEMVDPDAESHEVIPEEPKKAITSPPQRKTANKDKNPKAPEGEVKPEEEMTKPTDIITPAHVKAVRARISKAAEKGKNLDEPALCKMLKIENFEQMNYGQLNWFNNMMEKNGI